MTVESLVEHRRRADQVRSRLKEIKEMQMRLMNLGYYRGPLDGKFTPETTEAVKKFQEDYT